MLATLPSAHCNICKRFLYTPRPISNIIKKSFCKNFKLNCSYDFYGKITSSILSHKGIIKNVNYSDSVEIIFYIESDKFNNLKNSINDITCGNTDIIFLEESFEIV